MQTYRDITSVITFIRINKQRSPANKIEELKTLNLGVGSSI